MKTSAQKNILILLGYDYTNQIKGIISENIFCYIHKSYKKYFTKKNLELLKDDLGKNLYIDNKSKQTIPRLITEKKINVLITLGWRKILDLEEFKNIQYLINIHPAILPEYKGYHPVPYVLLNEEKVHGITAHRINKKVDDGEIVLKHIFSINSFSTLQSLQYEVKNRLGNFLEELFCKIKNDEITLLLNDSSKTIITAPKRVEKDSQLDLNQTLEDVFRMVKASDSKRFPAYFIYENEKVYVKMHRDENAKRQTKFDI